MKKREGIFLTSHFVPWYILFSYNLHGLL